MNPCLSPLILTAAEAVARPDEAWVLMGARHSAIRRSVEKALAGRVPAAFSTMAQPHPQLAPSGIAALDDPALLGGLPRGCLTEICGPASSGRTTVLLAALAAATARQEACCLIDTTNAFDPRSAATAGIDFSRLLWVRCGKSRKFGTPAQPISESSAYAKTQRPKDRNRRWPMADGRRSRDRQSAFLRLEQTLKVADIILQGGGFGLVAIDMADLAPAETSRVPLTSWFRFRRAVERTPTVLLVLGMEPSAGTCASAVVKLSAAASDPLKRGSDLPSHARLLENVEICVEASRAAWRKQSTAAAAQFAVHAQWAG